MRPVPFWGLLLDEPKLKKVIALVDGFNLYHAIDDLNLDPVTKKKAHNKNYLKWLNLWALSQALIHPRNDVLSEVYWFSAYANWRSQDSQSRHQVYRRALQSAGVRAVIGNFKMKPRKCPKCHHKWDGHEEKESDVNLAIHLVRLAFENRFDKAIVFSADTDLAPAIKMIKETHPEKEVLVAIPERRMGKTNALANAAHGKIRLNEGHFARNLFSDRIEADSSPIIRPAHYAPPTP